MDFAKRIPVETLQKRVRMEQIRHSKDAIRVIQEGLSIMNVSRNKLISSLQTHPHCVLVRGTMQEYDSQQDRLGIENCRGSGQRFLEHEYLGTFACQQALEGWLRIGAGSYTKFQRTFSATEMREAVAFSSSV